MNRYAVTTLTVLFALALACVAHAEGGVWVWIDESGSYHFSDQQLTPSYKPFTPSRPRHAATYRGPVGPTTAARHVRAAEAVIADLSAQYGIDANLVRAVAKIESNFDPWAVSKRGARGLMQLMPETAADYGVTDVHDLRQNVDAGIQILCELLIRFDGELPFVLAAYNAGLSTVLQYGGVPPFPETRDYIERVTRQYLRYRAETKR